MKKTNLPAGYSINTSLIWDIQGETVFYTFTDYPGGNADAKIWFDKLDRETKKQTLSFNNQWLTQITTYDVLGSVATNTNTYFSNETPLTTSNTYDAYHRLQLTSNGLSTSSHTYTKLAGGKMQVITQNSAGQSTTRISDATGKIVSTIDNGGQLDFTFDCWGNQTQVNHGSTILITSTFDSYGRQIGLTDKNTGAITYEYDAYGQLKQQTDANGNTYTMTYDDLGRLITRQGPEGTTTFEYYKNISTGCNNNNLSKVTGFNGVIKENTYNTLMRLQSEKVTIDGADYITQYGYDTYGKLINTTLPSGVVVNNIYDANGGLLTVTGGNAASPITLFNATGVNGFGQYTSYTLGNGKTSQNTFNYGIPARYYTQGVQDLNLNFDYATGNVLSRSDVLKNITETFNYDNLNRITGSIVNGVQQFNLSYDGNTSFSMGNIISKTDAGNYVYKNDKVHAVAYITNPAGAQSPPTNISTSQQIISYTPFLKTASITEDIYQLDFTYGPDYQRIKSVLKQNSIINETKYYLGNYERQVNGSSTREINYVTGGNGLCAVIVRENGVNNFYFVYTDQIGSILSVTDINGNIVAEQNFDAWGRKRNPANWQYSTVPSVPAWLYRGYTSHEHLPQFSLINMNGRMYDPIQGRMLSPDNYVSYPLWSQAYNRYTYAGNNPLIYTDPDGNWFGIDDIIVSSVGFVMGYVGYGITKGNWGGKALLTGWTSAIIAEASYLTLGGGLVGSSTAKMGGAGSISAAKSFAGSYAFSQAQTVGLNYNQIHNSSDWRAYGLLSAYSFFSAVQAGFNSEYMEKKVDKWLWADSKDYTNYLNNNRGESSNELGGFISVLGKEIFKKYDPSTNTWSRENGSIFWKAFFYGMGTAWAGRSAGNENMAEGVYKAGGFETFINFSVQTAYNSIFNFLVFKGNSGSEYPEYNSNLINLLLR